MSAPSSPQVSLRRDALTARDLLIAGMSYMAPGFSFFFTTALIASAAGIHTPVAYLLAGLGVLAAGAAFAEFSKRAPSAGALQVFVERGFGRIAATAAGLVLVAGYICLQAGVLALFGGWTAHLLDMAFGITVPWLLLSVLGLVLTTALMVRGVQMSVRTTWVLFIIEFALVAAVCAVVLIRGGDAGLTAAPFNLAATGSDAWSGIALGMVFCVFSFVGFEGAVSFAEETPNPRKALPVAVIGGVVVMLLLYVVGTYAAVIGFGTASIDALAGDGEPIATLASRYAPVLGPLLAFAVFTSIVANLMAAGNANARILFNMGRERLIVRTLGRVHAGTRTPAVAIITFMASTGVLCLAAGLRWDYLTAFGSVAGFGAFLAIIIYMLSTIALPVYLRRRGERLHPVRHVAVPVVGTAIWLVPLWGSLKPGQTFPASIYPILALIIAVLATLYAIAVHGRHRGRRVDPAALEPEPGVTQPG